MEKDADAFIGELEKKVFDKTRNYFVELMRHENLPLPGETEQDFIETVGIIYRTAVGEVVEDTIVSLLEDTPRMARYAHEDLDKVWARFTDLQYLRDTGLRREEAQQIVTVVKDVLLKGELSFPVRLDADDQNYEIRRVDGCLEITRV